MSCNVRALRREVDGDADVIQFSFSNFLFSFITFDLGLQIKSNKFVKICKIPISQHRHLGTIFGQNKITKIPFWSNLPYMAIWEFPN